MKKIFVAITLAVSLNSVSALTFTFDGMQEPVITITPERSTGLDKLFVAYDISQISRMSIGETKGDVEVSKYSNLGGGYAIPVPVRKEGNEVILDNPEGDMGYIITDSGTSTYIWLTNYLPHKLELTSASPASEQECENTRIDVIGSGDAIYYYTIDGRAVELSREIDVDYLNLEWDESSESFRQKEFSKTLDHLSNTIVITPPLYCNSKVNISGDRFLKEWGKGVTVESGLVYATGIAVQTSAEQTNKPDDEDGDNASNIIRSDTQGMGGSAPVDIEFKAYTTDAVIHNEWQIASDAGFDYIDYRFNTQNLDYSFMDEGTYYVRFVGSNSDGTCETYGDTYTIGVGASELRIPNAFTPNGDGVNDEWKVAYRSLTRFSCTIFDRYGNELFRFTDPSIGWDGKYKGKEVSPGVYFYVIEAEGADGKKYKKGGDINIIKSKKYSGQTNQPIE